MKSIRSLMINLDLIISSLKTEQVFPSIQKIPDLILEAYTYEYLKNTTDTLSDFFIEQVEPIDDQIKKEDI